MKQAFAGLLVLGLVAGVAISWRAAHQPPLPAATLVFVNEHRGVAQVHARFSDGGQEAWTESPHAHHPSGPFLGGLLIIESDGEGDQHRERLLWRAPDAGLTELHPQTLRARSAVAVGDGVLLESSQTGFSDVVLAFVDGGSTQLTHDGEAGSFQPRGTGGAVFYVSSRSGNPELYERSPDGGDRQLTSHPGEDVAPVPSPDGRTVLFTSTRGGTDQLFLLDRQTLAVKPLHTAPLDPGPRAKAEREDLEREASWHGNEVVFAARVKNGHLRIWVVNAADGSARALTDGQQDDDQPALSPDGQWVAFARGDEGASRVFAVPFTGGAAVQLTQGEGAQWLPCWLP